MSFRDKDMENALMQSEDKYFFIRSLANILHQPRQGHFGFSPRDTQFETYLRAVELTAYTPNTVTSKDKLISLIG